MPQDFEYALQRRLPDKSDFLRSIAYEVSLERLRVIRKKERNITTSRKKTTLTDFCIIRRTHKLYERMLRKFKGDLALWNEWVQFCSSCRSSKQMSKVLTRMTQLFPTEAAVWAYAAAWELEHHHNATVARSLMQTGIRMCKGDARLWVEYFRMELLYAARLVARRQVLFKGEDGGMGAAAGVDGGVRDADEVDGEMDDATRALLSGGVARVVYRNAMESLGGGVKTVEAVLDFLRVLRPLPILNRQELEDEILGDAMERCVRLQQEGSVSGAVAAVARVLRGLASFVFHRSREDGGLFQEAVEVALGVFEEYEGTMSTVLYEAKVDVLGEMFEEAMASGEDESTLLYLLDQCIQTGKDALSKDDSPPGAEHVASTSAIILAVSRANQRKGQCLTDSLSVLARSEADDVVTERLFVSNLAASMRSRGDAPDGAGADEGHCLDDFHRFVDDDTGKALRRPDAWFSMIASCAQDPVRLVKLGEAYALDQLASTTGAPNGVGGVVASSLASSLYLNVGITEARSFCDAVLKGPLPGARFITDVAMMEQGLGSEERNIHRIRRIYDTGTEIYGSSSVKLWLEYYAFERSLCGSTSNADTVHWRATQILDDADAFVVQAQSLN